MQNLCRFLNQELRNAPGRAGYTLRLSLSCAVLITLFMALQIPFLPVALIVVFYVSQSNVLMIKLVSVVLLFTVSVALGSVLLIIKWTYDYPLIRLVASVFLFFCAIYLMRVLGKLGLAFFVVALAIIYAQTFPSMTSQSEILVRLLLWLWVAVNAAVVVTLLVNTCFRQAFPGYQFKARLAIILHDVSALLAQPGSKLQPTFKDIASQVSELQSLFKMASRSSPDIAASPQVWRSLMAATLRCYHLAALLLPEDVHSAARQQISVMLQRMAGQLQEGNFPEYQQVSLTPDTVNWAILQAMADVLTQLARGESVQIPVGEAEEGLLLPDAWTNKAYLHFALKTVLATLLCYVFYTAADWQGLHTIMLSCVIVSQPGLGATMQKIWLRVVGVLVATLLALFLLVFVQPRTDSLSGLLTMTIPVMALAAWVAAGSERIAYAGIQIAFTFSLAFLGWFGPMTNLTELRDRVIGILLGVLVSSVVHLYLWPDSEAPQLKSRMANLYRQMAEMLVAKNDDTRLVRLFSLLPDTEKLMNRVAAEPLTIYVHPCPEARYWPVKNTFDIAQEIARLSEGYRLYATQGDMFLIRCAQELQTYADGIECQAVPENGCDLVVDPENPFGLPIMKLLAMLPAWGPVPSSIPQQGEIKS